MQVTQTRPAPTSSRVRRGWWLLPVGLFLAVRLADALMLLVLGQQQSPDSAWADHPEGQPPFAVNPPSYDNLVANWDGQWYRTIAEDGYPEDLVRRDGVVVQSAWAFYPALPMLARLVMLTGLPFGVAASLVSLLAGAAASVLLFRMLQRTAGRFAATAAVLGLSLFPAAPVLGFAYSESLAILLVLGALWALREQRYGAVLLLALALSVTRPVVLPLAAVVAVHGLVRWRTEGDAFGARQRLAVAGTAVATGLSFLIWPTVVGRATGERDAYLLVHQSWRVEIGGSGRWDSWLAVVLDNAQVAAMVAFALVLLAYLVLRPGAGRWPAEARAWMVLYSLYVVAATRPTTSIVRYALLAVFPYWPFPEEGEHWTPRRQGVVLAGVVVVGLVAQCLWLRYYWVPSDVSRGFP